MHVMRKGREFYPQLYDKAISLYKKGLSIKEIAQKLGISYSCAYHWIKGLRKPEQGNLLRFIDFIKKHGPIPVAEIKDHFPKHNELFLISSRRGLGIRRYTLKRKYGEYSTWYYFLGQEHFLEKKIKTLIEKYKENLEKFVGLN